MIDNSLKISFNFNKPDEAAIVVFKTYGGGYFTGESNVSIVKTIVGRKAIDLYSELSGKPIEEIEEEAESGKE